MARGRLLSKSLSTSRRFAIAGQQGGKLGEFCQVLFPLLISHADDFGRLAGDAFTVQALVFPTSPRKESEFEVALVTLTHVGLIQRASVGGEWVIQIIGFDGHQPGLTRRTKSRYPEISNEIAASVEVPGTPVNFTGIHSEQNRTELNRTEGERNGTERNSALAVADRFGEFYALYPASPNNPGPFHAKAAWRKLKPSSELQHTIVDAIQKQRDWPRSTKEGGRFVCTPQKWLSEHRWEAPDPPAEKWEPPAHSKTAGNVKAGQEALVMLERMRA
jgi:hypothetical protein